jgi:hypothetical protein
LSSFHDAPTVPDHPLDNPAWEALRNYHAHFAQRGGGALYDRLGFVERSAIPYWQVRRSAVATDR